MISKRRVAQQIVAGFLALLLAFTPLSPLMLVPALAPVVPAQAESLKENLEQCLNTVKDGAKILKGILDVVKNPNFLLCTSSASSGDVVTIAVMAAMTAFWIFNQGAFTDVESCNGMIATTITQVIALALNEAMDAGLDGIIGGIFGDKGVADIKAIVAAITGDGDVSQALLNPLVQQAQEAFNAAMQQAQAAFDQAAAAPKATLDLALASAQNALNSGQITQEAFDGLKQEAEQKFANDPVTQAA
jgi:hypothetical protein